ncbi:TaqI-like C-terminal specificity domain-containing protein [Akkermansia muciniphila]|uniref:TaqI-like C-terminal specificity domain-containing protein n=1 Tax=Akkermansia muciniphila TaxID=239935 RepID=UPI0033BF5507
MSDFVQQNHTICSFESDESWVILSPIEQSIKRKIEAVGTPLKDWDIQIYRGVLTGCNEAFIISTEKRDEILANCQTASERSRTAELIRPILRGRDIKRYGYDWAGLWLIATFPACHYNIEDYLAVKNYLLSIGIERLEQTGKTHIVNGEKIKARKKTCHEWFETQDSISYWEDFYKPKIFYADITQDLNFCKCNEVMFCNNTTYFITSNSQNLPEHLITTLNSKLINWYYRTLSVQLGKNAIRMFSIYVLNIPIPKIIIGNIYETYNLSNEEIDFIEQKK